MLRYYWLYEPSNWDLHTAVIIGFNVMTLWPLHGGCPCITAALHAGGGLVGDAPALLQHGVHQICIASRHQDLHQCRYVLCSLLHLLGNFKLQQRSGACSTAWLVHVSSVQLKCFNA